MGNGMNKILPGLYLGNFRDAKDQKQLNENSITHILSIHDNARPILEDKKYLCIHAADTPDQNLLPYFRDCIKFIHEARLQGGSVLVHCLAGVSRSVTVTVAYIITLTTHNWRDTLSAIKHAREVANPNFGFTNQLQKYETNGVEKEREWLKCSYPNTDSAEDQRLIAELCQLYRESENKEIRRTPAQASGSTTAAYPLNRKDDHEESSTWSNKNRMGMLVDDADS